MAPDLTAIRTILHELFEDAPSEWPRRLDELCALHPEHASELRRRYELLCATGLDRHTEAGAPPLAAEFPAQLGEFRLLRRLGSGGMGMVFVAEQTSLGREVAVKVVRPELLFADAARERFRREIEAVARLEHPAIVPVLTHGEERGVPYYVMPLLHGVAADAVLRQFAQHDARRLRGADLRAAIAGDEAAQDGSTEFAGTWWQACVRLMRQVALGVHHAHRRGIVHRDVKPANILLTTDGRALLFDFGLAHVRDDARITRLGEEPGSPAYMSPEQTRGAATDERTDIYSLAATLHHLLSLTCPFPVEDVEVMRARILAGQTNRLQPRSVPTELQVVLAAAMDIDRELRPSTALALADDLQAVLEGRPIRTRRLPFALRARRWCGRHRVATVAAVAVLAMGAILPGALYWQQLATSSALRKLTSQAQQQAERAERNFMRSLAVIDDMLLRAGDEKLRNVPAAQRVSADLLQRAVDHLDRAAAEEHDSSAFRPRHIVAIQRLANLRSELGDTAAAEALAERSVQMLQAEGGSSDVDRLRRAHAAMALAATRLRAGTLPAAMATVEAAERELEQVAPDAESAAGVRARLTTTRAGILEMRGDAAGACDAFAAALVAFRLQLREDLPGHRREAAVGAYNLARMLRRKKETTAALDLLGEATQWLEGIDEHAGSWPTAAMIRALVQAERAQVLKVVGDVTGSIDAWTAAIAQSELLVARYPDVAHLQLGLGGNRCNLAIQYSELRDFVASRGLLVAAVVDLDQALRTAPDDAQAGTFLFQARKTLCFVLREQGDWEALAPAAREYGRLPNDPSAPLGAARHLLRCAEHAEGQAATDLRDEAMRFLLERERRGWGNVGLDDALYAALQSDPRFQALRARTRR